MNEKKPKKPNESPTRNKEPWESKAKSWVIVDKKKMDLSGPNSPTSGVSNASENNENYFSLDQNFAKLETNDINKNVKFDSPVKCAQRNLKKHGLKDAKIEDEEEK